MTVQEEEEEEEEDEEELPGIDRPPSIESPMTKAPRYLLAQSPVHRLSYSDSNREPCALCLSPLDLSTRVKLNQHW